MAWIEDKDHGTRESLEVYLKAKNRETDKTLKIFNRRWVKASSTLNQHILFSIVMFQDVSQSEIKYN